MPDVAFVTFGDSFGARVIRLDESEQIEAAWDEALTAIGIVGNQPIAMEMALGDATDCIAFSTSWGVEKPSPESVAPVAAECDVERQHIVYVGGRSDNDFLLATTTGVTAAFIRRGPWGHFHPKHPDVTRSDFRLDNLHELAKRLATSAASKSPDRGTFYLTLILPSDRPDRCSVSCTRLSEWG